MAEALVGKLAFISADGADGFTLKVQVTDLGQIVVPLDLRALARLNSQCADAIATVAKLRTVPPQEPEKYFQR